MRQMKDSGIEWIGEIPAEWEVKRVCHIFQQRLEKGSESNILLAATQQYGIIPQSEIEGVVKVKEDTNLQAFKTVKENDYVISLRSFQGGIEHSQYSGVCSPAYQVFFNRKKINHTFFKYLFKSDCFISKINSLTVGIRDGKNIQYNELKTVFIPFPPSPNNSALPTTSTPSAPASMKQWSLSARAGKNSVPTNSPSLPKPSPGALTRMSP